MSSCALGSDTKGGTITTCTGHLSCMSRRKERRNLSVSAGGLFIFQFAATMGLRWEGSMGVGVERLLSSSLQLLSDSFWNCNNCSLIAHHILSHWWKLWQLF